MGDPAAAAAVAELLTKSSALATLVADTGHWVHCRDDGWTDYLEQEIKSNVAGSVMTVAEMLGGAPPQHWYWMEGNEIWVRVLNAFADTKEGVPLGENVGKDDDWGPPIGRCTGTLLWEAAEDCVTLLIEGTQTTDGGEKPLKYTITRTFVDGEMIIRFQNELTGNRGARIFKRYPWYKVANNTGKTVRMCTYGSGDFVMMSACLDAELAPGTAYRDTHDPNVKEEQAYFYLPDGRSYSTGSLKAFSALELSEDMFE